MMGGEEYSPLHCLGSYQMKKKKNNKNKRRFSDEQIKLMESIFESESKLEPRKKLELAKELGLQPRQVAIWFQNRRARWKSKQLERDYSKLKASYDTLAEKFESLKKEKQSLSIQVQKLSDVSEKPEELNGNSSDGKLHNDDTKCEFKRKPYLLLEESDSRVITNSNTEDENFEYLDHDELDLMNMAEYTDGALTSPENWCGFNSNDLLDQSCSSSQWWEIWS